LEEAAVTAVERITHARRDTETVIDLIKQRQQPGAELEGSFKALNDQAVELRKGLDELEKRFRTPPETKGIVYDEDKVMNQIGLAQYYVGSGSGAPTATAAIYVDLATRSLSEAEAAVDRFMSTDLTDFRNSVAAAGIGLFGSAAKP
jgi:predicted nuclease with TOPRIM domain